MQAYLHDAGENLSGISRFDAGGNVIVGTTCFVHDALGRITAVGPARTVQLNSPACQSEAELSSVTVRFRYDAWNRRVARQDGTGPWKHWVATQQGQPLEELQRPAPATSQWTVLRDYVWLEGRPIAQVEYPGPAGGTEGHVYAVHTDHLGQPRALTSKARVVVWSASVARPYGEVAESLTADPASGRQVVSNLRLPGQYDERLSIYGVPGPYYNWHRWYLPSMGRYMELDPIALAGGFNGPFGPNWYGYAEGNPARYVDASGLASCSYCIRSFDEGPIVPGSYAMNPDSRPNHEGFWRLEPNPPVKGWEYYLRRKRSGFMLHPGSRSLGCITTDREVPEAMEQYSAVNELLWSELGTNTLVVTP